MSKKKIKIYNDQIIKCCINNMEPHKTLVPVFKLLRPFVIVDFDYRGMRSNKKTKSNIIIDKTLGSVTFRIKKDTAKKIGFYPYNIRQYKMIFKSFYDLKKFKSKHPDRLSGFEEQNALKHVIHFSSISHRDVVKFEFPKLLNWIGRLEPDVFLKIEKILFELAG